MATAEQLEALTLFLSGENTVIEAAAGSGKTSTLKLIASYATGRKGLYLAFNKSVQLDAQKSFQPFDVTVKTAHSLAYQEFGRPRAHRMTKQFMHWAEKARILGVDSRVTFRDTTVSRALLINLANDTLTKFCQSADAKISDKFVEISPRLRHDLNSEEQEHLTEIVYNLAEIMWADVREENGELIVNHQHYLKMFQLSDPTLPVDYILLDEAQDSDPVTAAIVLAQNHAQKIVVGDPSQQIYSWRGAIDAMGMFGGVRTRLTQSFRFGEHIAEEANVWLELLGTDMRVVGLAGKESRVGVVHNADSIITRTNAGAINELLTEQQKGRRVSVAGEHKVKELEKLTKACLELKEKGKTDHPEFSAFKSWSDVVDFAKTEDGSQVAPLVSVVEQFGPHKMMKAINAIVLPSLADVTISTAHVSKGLEWAKVRVAQDFREPTEKDGNILPLDDDEMRLCYVVTTRAMEELDNRAFAWNRSLIRQ